MDIEQLRIDFVNLGKSTSGTSCDHSDAQRYLSGKGNFNDPFQLIVQAFMDGCMPCRNNLVQDCIEKSLLENFIIKLGDPDHDSSLYLEIFKDFEEKILEYDANQGKLISLAIQGDDLDMVKHLLNKWPSMLRVLIEGKTVFDFALNQKMANDEILQYIVHLLEYSVFFSENQIFLLNDLFAACSSKECPLNVIEKLISLSSLLSEEQHKENLKQALDASLYTAKRFEIMKLLLENKFLVTEHYYRDIPFIHYVVVSHCLFAFDYVVENFGDQINFMEEFEGNTILHIACEFLWKSKFASNILKVEPKLANVQSTADGSTPLMIAASEGNLSLVKLLVEEYGVDVNYKDFVGASTFWYACVKRFGHIMVYLIEKGAFISIKTKPIYCTLAEGQTNNVRYRMEQFILSSMKQLLDNEINFGAFIQTLEILHQDDDTNDFKHILDFKKTALFNLGCENKCLDPELTIRFNGIIRALAEFQYIDINQTVADMVQFILTSDEITLQQKKYLFINAVLNGLMPFGKDIDLNEILTTIDSAGEKELLMIKTCLMLRQNHANDFFER